MRCTELPGHVCNYSRIAPVCACTRSTGSINSGYCTRRLPPTCERSTAFLTRRQIQICATGSGERFASRSDAEIWWPVPSRGITQDNRVRYARLRRGCVDTDRFLDSTPEACVPTT